jgi:hypothetical protein
MRQRSETVDMHWLWLSDKVAMSRMHDTMAGMNSGQTVKMAVSMEGLKSVCNGILEEGGRILRVESMRDEPGYFVHAAKS